MNSKILLTSPIAAGLVLESIDSSHLERLRTWKNAYREKFFQRAIITPRQQAEWFAAYLARPDDYMFVVKTGGHAIGCLGARREAGGADIYNLMRGAEGGPAAAMRAAVKMVCTFAGMRLGYPVRGKVLAGNRSAMRWQRTCGACVTGEGVYGADRYYVVEFRAESTVPVAVHEAAESIVEP